ncbi:hypothetical protein K402DRAFT_204885 [Aulographum hederae CBS 113979]|uniref:Uncharacterized protein n=1 Tax=Aulographum hederae CBS 113979 TaxID=1176131 RepID=A0A6G1HD49_9PEZI|nr:hypothetical protein K402DRAFT_204885 [Aulographum hederae CBS 113979]
MPRRTHRPPLRLDGEDAGLDAINFPQLPRVRSYHVGCLIAPREFGPKSKSFTIRLSSCQVQANSIQTRETSNGRYEVGNRGTMIGSSVNAVWIPLPSCSLPTFSANSMDGPFASTTLKWNLLLGPSRFHIPRFLNHRHSAASTTAVEEFTIGSLMARTRLQSPKPGGRSHKISGAGLWGSVSGVVSVLACDVSDFEFGYS